MPDVEPVRRSVVPQAAGRSLWVAAVWTGAGAALVCAVVAIAAVAVCWLPASAGAGNSGSAIRAGLLTFLAALHGGITVGGLDAAFVPLGLTLVAGAIAWRAGAGLADAAEQLGEEDTARLVRAGLMQTGSFVVLCGVAAAGSHLGTSRVSVPGAVIAGAALFAGTAGVAFVRFSALGDDIADRAPAWLEPAARIAAATMAVYLGAGALLVLCSLVAHHDQVEAISRQVGGGWAGVPVLLLGVLAAPNAAIAASSYLAGTGFVVGSGTTVSLGSRPHGTLPAFPVLGAVPSGPAPWSVWLLAVLTPLAAGCVVSRLALRARAAARLARRRRDRFGSAACRRRLAVAVRPRRDGWLRHRFGWCARCRGRIPRPSRGAGRGGVGRLGRRAEGVAGRADRGCIYCR